MKLTSVHFMFGLLCMLALVFAYKGMLDARDAIYEHENSLKWATPEQILEGISHE